MRLNNGVCQCECRKRAILNNRIQAIPERFRGCRLESYLPKNPCQSQALQRINGNPQGSYAICGAYGSGKTHLATAQYVRLLETDRPTLFFSMAELMAELRTAETRSDYVCIVRDRVRYAEKFHLFIDDIDKFKVTDFKFEVMFDLIDTIYKRNLGLTVTSNYGFRDLVEFEKVHPAIVRRIDDACRLVELR